MTWYEYIAQGINIIFASGLRVVACRWLDMDWKHVRLGFIFVFVVEVKVSIEGLNHSPPLGIDSAGTASGPRGRFAWTIHTSSE
jgi:hypothetical protein